MRYAIVIDGLVVNVILWDGVTPYSADGEIVTLQEGERVGPGWTRVGEEWIAPPPEPTEGADAPAEDSELAASP